MSETLLRRFAFHNDMEVIDLENLQFHMMLIYSVYN